MPIFSLVLLNFIVFHSLPNNGSKKILDYHYYQSMALIFIFNLYPDLPCATFMALSAFLLINRNDVFDTHKKILYSLSATFSIFLAFLFKLTAYWLLPLWLYYFGKDLKNNNIHNIKYFFLPAVIWGLSLGLTYLYFCNSVWDDLLLDLLRLIEYLGRIYGLLNLKKHY